MKKLNLFFVAAATLAAGFLTSCSNDTIVPATITFTQPDGATVEVYIGSDYTFKGTVESSSAEVTLTEVKFYNGADEIVDAAEDLTADALTSYVFDVKVTNIQKDFTFKVVAYDSSEGMGEATVDVTTVEQPLVEKTIELGHFNETPGAFIDLETGAIYDDSGAGGDQGNAFENADKIDMLYYCSTVATSQASFFSPKEYSTIANNYADIDKWTVLAQTKFKKGTSSDYDGATVATLVAAAPTVQAVRLIAAGDVYFFKTDAGKHGVIKVENLVLNPAKSIETITLKYKIEVASAK